MALRVVLRAVTVLLVLCLVALGIVAWRLAGPGRGALTASAPRPAAEQADMGEFTPLAAPRPAPEANVAALDGTIVNLSDFRGHLVLVNLWATWCAPCVKEMPSLARLQRKLGDLVILAISEDRNGAKAVEPFLAKLKLGGLRTFLDPKNVMTHAFGVEGLPTSFLIDRDGKIVGKLEGAAEWDSPKMVQLIEGYLAPPVHRS